MSKERFAQFFLKKPREEKPTKATGLEVKHCNRGEGDPCPVHRRIHKGPTGRTRRLLELQKRKQEYRVRDEERKPSSVPITSQLLRIEFVQTDLLGAVVSKPERGSARIRVVSDHRMVAGKLPRAA